MSNAVFRAMIHQQNAIDKQILYAIIMARESERFRGVVTLPLDRNQLLITRQLVRMRLMTIHDDDDDDIKIPPTHNFILTSATVDSSWRCAICQDIEGDIVLHPNNCHAFHRACINESLRNNIQCPLCSGCVTPFNMIKID